ncbi:MAG: cytochrome c [Actinomycetia bacterium]|nr:cytochrome c [Actinomycetes bacterium]
MQGIRFRRRHISRAGVSLLVVVLLFVAFPSLATDEDAPEQGTDAEESEHFEPIVPRNDLSIGGELYRSECSACHAATGIGGTLSFRDNAPPLKGFSALELAAAIRGGPGEMPFFGPDSISDKELEQIVTYSLYLQNPEDLGGAPIGRVGPVMEGLVAWAVGMSAIVLGLMWIGDRRA